MHLHSKSSDENSQKAYRTLYESVKYANPKYMFRKPELATPLSKFHSFLAAEIDFFCLNEMLHVNCQNNVFHYPLVAGVVGAPARGHLKFSTSNILEEML